MTPEHVLAGLIFFIVLTACVTSWIGSRPNDRPWY